ncbi:MAG: anaerobic ribonucleoside-triphosphate reductase activating protein [Planctomycetota bacterium]|jgi:pyruvate formate lyase activating enzyme
MQIKGFIPSSLIEWEGKIASVLFLPGCNLRCPYCHAGHLILQPERLESLSREQLFAYMRDHADWLDGVVVTGGEPTLHGEELLDLLKEVRAIPLQVMLETNGTRPEPLARLIEDGLLDAIAMDVKAPLTPEDYRRVAGAPVDVEAVRRSIALIKQSGLDYEFRVTLVPGLVGREELSRMAGDLEGARRVALQNFRPDHCLSAALRSVRPYAPAALDALERIVAPVAERLVVRGRDRAAVAAAGAD